MKEKISEQVKEKISKQAQVIAGEPEATSCKKKTRLQVCSGGTLSSKLPCQVPVDTLQVMNKFKSMLT